MKRLIFAVVGCVLAASVMADEKDTSPLSKKEMLHVKMGGGKVQQPGTQSGEIVIVNAQKLADAAWLTDRSDYFTKETHFKVTTRSGAFDLASPKVEGSMTLFVVNDVKLPRVLLAPENRWAVVNVQPLKSDKPAFFEARVKKEISRAFAMLCGGMSSNFEMSLVGPVPTTEKLDTFVDAQIPFDILNRMPFHMKAFGVTPARVVTYRRACEEGWAAKPDGRVQQAVWDEVHQLPTKPITIEPEKTPVKK